MVVVSGIKEYFFKKNSFFKVINRITGREVRDLKFIGGGYDKLV